MDGKTITTCVSIVCLTVLGTANLIYSGQDGAIITTISSLIAGVAGYTLKSAQVRRQTAR